jgi:hypothetical protein
VWGFTGSGSEPSVSRPGRLARCMGSGVALCRVAVRSVVKFSKQGPANPALPADALSHSHLGCPAVVGGFEEG